MPAIDAEDLAIAPGTLVADRFVVERLAGAGGMGSVYAAQDRFDGARVALKVLRSRGPDETGRFVREAEVLRALEHPGVVRYVAHGEMRGAPFLAMEWLEGEDLSDRLARGPMPAADVVTLARAVADALGAAHARGVVHRDVKPGNVRLSARGPVLCDFGIARALDLGAPSLTRAGTILGTPLTMAPEQARGANDVDARADVFALGCVMHECLTGVPPFAAKSVVAVLARILLDPVGPPSASAADVPPFLDALVLRMLEKDPERRPAHGAAVRDLLDRASSGVALTPPAPPRRGLSLAETRYATCVVLRGTHALAETLSVDRTQTDARALRAVAAAHGALLEQLVDGSILALVLGGTREEQAIRGARCALALSDATGLPAAFAAGRATTGAAVPVGDAVERALVVLGDTKPGEVVTDETTSTLLRARFITQPRGSKARVIGPSGDARHTVRGRATPFVGRRRELASLVALVGEAMEEGVLRTTRVLAAPGLGKSRLAVELADRIQADHPGVRVVRLTADDALSSSPNAFARALSNALLEIVAREALSPELLPFAQDLAGHTPEGGGQSLVALVRGDAGARRARHVRALAELVVVAAHGGLALLLDDAQWIDDASASLFDDALSSREYAGVAIVALARPEGTALFSGRAVEELRLSPLAARAAEELARHVLGDAAETLRVARAVDAAAGHPLLLEEILRAGPSETGDDVVALVQARIAQLAPEARVVLRAASIVGARAWEGAIAVLCDRDRAAVAAALSTCVRAELLERAHESAFPPEPEVRFRHALMREAAYAMLTDDDRALGHRLALSWLESVGMEDRLVLAEHAIRSAQSDEDRARASERLVRAAHAAPRAADAFAALDRARELAQSAGQTGHSAFAEAARARAFWIARGGSRVVARQRLDDAIAVARAAGDTRTVAAMLPSRAWTYAATGEPEAAARDLLEAEALAEDDIGRFAVAKARSTVSFFTADLERTIALTDEVIAQASVLGLARELATHSHNAAEWRIRAGRLDEAEPILRASTERASALGEAAIVAMNGALSSFVHATRHGDATREADLDGMLRVAERFAAVDLAWEEVTVRVFHAHAMVRARGPEAARDAFTALGARAAALQMPSYVADAERALAALDEGRTPTLG